MKKLLLVCIAFLLVGTLTSCYPEPLSDIDVGIYEKEKALARSNYEKNKIDELTNTTPNKLNSGYNGKYEWYKYSDSFDIVYVNEDNVTEMCGAYIDASTDTKYNTSKGITIESTKDEIVKAYGKGYEVSEDGKTIFYLYEKYPGRKFVFKDYKKENGYVGDELENLLRENIFTEKDDIDDIEDLHEKAFILDIMSAKQDIDWVIYIGFSFENDVESSSNKLESIFMSTLYHKIILDEAMENVDG